MRLEVKLFLDYSRYTPVLCVQRSTCTSLGTHVQNGMACDLHEIPVMQSITAHDGWLAHRDDIQSISWYPNLGPGTSRKAVVLHLPLLQEVLQHRLEQKALSFDS